MDASVISAEVIAQKLKNLGWDVHITSEADKPYGIDCACNNVFCHVTNLHDMKPITMKLEKRQLARVIKYMVLFNSLETVQVLTNGYVYEYYSHTKLLGQFPFPLAPESLADLVAGGVKHG